MSSPANLRTVPITAGQGRAGLDPQVIRRDFPVFENNPGLVFLDTAASAQKPRAVIDGVADYYRRDYANVHRGVYRLSARSTELYEEAGDEILITELEHHSNIVPWQMLRDRLGIKLVVAPIDATVGLDMAAFERLLGPRTRLVAIPHIANSTGTLLPVESIVRLAHAQGASVLIDGAQAAPRMAVDVRAIDCDFYT